MKLCLFLWTGRPTNTRARSRGDSLSLRFQGGGRACNGALQHLCYMATSSLSLVGSLLGHAATVCCPFNWIWAQPIQLARTGGLPIRNLWRRSHKTPEYGADREMSSGSSFSPQCWGAWCLQIGSRWQISFQGFSCWCRQALLLPLLPGNRWIDQGEMCYLLSFRHQSPMGLRKTVLGCCLPIYSSDSLCKHYW